RFFFLLGSYLVLDLPVSKLKKTLFWDLYPAIILSVLFGFFNSYLPQLGGVIGYEINLYMQDYLAKTGTLLVLIFGLVVFLILRIKISPDAIKAYFEKRQQEREAAEEERKLQEMAAQQADSNFTAAPIQTNNSTTPTEPDYDEENDP